MKKIEELRVDTAALPDRVRESLDTSVGDTPDSFTYAAVSIFRARPWTSLFRVSYSARLRAVRVCPGRLTLAEARKNWRWYLGSRSRSCGWRRDPGSTEALAGIDWAEFETTSASLVGAVVYDADGKVWVRTAADRWPVGPIPSAVPVAAYLTQ